MLTWFVRIGLPAYTRLYPPLYAINAIGVLFNLVRILGEVSLVSLHRARHIWMSFVSDEQY
jgi:hypothetical protein